MSYKSKSTGQEIWQTDYDMMWSILENYLESECFDNDTTQQQIAIVTILNDFIEVIE